MSNKLTPKQLHFARCVASGMPQAKAYREAYDCKPNALKETQQQAASRLMANPMVRARVDYLIRQKEAGIAASAVSDREKVLTKLRHMMDNAQPNDGNKLRAAELLGKSVGLFKDVVETQQSASSDDLLGELEAMIEAITEEPVPDRSVIVPDDEPLH